MKEPVTHIKSYLRDLLMIVIGVLIAFWVENLRESIQEDYITKEILINIKQDIIENSKLYEELSGIIDTVFVPELEEFQLGLEDNFISYEWYNESLGSFNGFNLQTHNSGFETLKSSGYLSNIKDDTLIHAFNNMFRENVIVEFNAEFKKNKARIAELLMTRIPPRKSTNDDIQLSDNERNSLYFLINNIIRDLKNTSQIISFNASSNRTWLNRLDNEIESL